MKQRHIRIISKTATWLFAISLGFSFCRVCVKYEFALGVIGIVLTALVLIALATNAAYYLAELYKEYKKRQAKQQAWQDHITKELGKTKDCFDWFERHRQEACHRLTRVERDLKESQKGSA
ncbi:MAG: hypothetical protein GY742_18400 [Hyphomicrobiales bacterium]|nr:hypothetical protein [Hyphomicrobiales bacterium]